MENFFSETILIVLPVLLLLAEGHLLHLNFVYLPITFTKYALIYQYYNLQIGPNLCPNVGKTAKRNIASKKLLYDTV